MDSCEPNLGTLMPSDDDVYASAARISDDVGVESVERILKGGNGCDETDEEDVSREMRPESRSSGL